MDTTTNPTAKKPTMPQVGDGMTLCYPQDSYPFVVVRVSASGKTVWVKPLEHVSKDTGHEVAYFEGPFPVWSHSYTDEERATMIQEGAQERAVRLSKHGYWTSHGSNFAAGGARYHRNYTH